MNRITGAPPGAPVGHQEGQLEEAKVELESAVQVVPEPADLHELLRLGAVILSSFGPIHGLSSWLMMVSG